MDPKPRRIRAAKPEAATPERHGPGGLADALRDRTQALQAEAERSGMVHEILRGRATRAGYALLLRNLLPGYQALEEGLERHRHAPGLRLFAWRTLFRAVALQADLDRIAGEAWEKTLVLLPAGEAYARRVAAAAEDGGTRLLAHAYVRYLGDLSDGQAMRKLLARTLDLAPEALSFYSFAGVADLGRFTDEFRDTLDRAAPEIEDVGAVIEEAADAFHLDIAVSKAVLGAVAE